MASLSQPLLGAGASAKNDWGRARAATSLTFTGNAEFRRGFELEIGLNALATADAGLSRFIDASVRGNAFAEARVNLQCQFPLNLFEQFGLAVGAEAVAQAAAGIEVGLGLVVGDFVALIRQNPESHGLPLDLLVLLLEEAKVGGHFEVHVAATAMAYASVQIVGEVVKDPGFHIQVDAGLGLLAGVGFSGGLDLGLRDFRRFYGRAVDRTVGSVVEGLSRSLAARNEPLLPVVKAMAPVASASLRLAYELGAYIVQHSPAQNRQEASNLANHCVGIVLEEAQRFLFQQFVEAGLRSFERLVSQQVPTLGRGVWDGLLPQRRALADALRAIPAEPFQPIPANVAYWSALIARATDLIAPLPPAASTDVVRGMTVLYAASELLARAIDTKVNQGEAYAFAAGAGRVTTPPPPFGGPLASQPAARVRSQVNHVLGRASSHSIDYADLVSYLVSDSAIGLLRSTVPDIDEYLSIFRHPAVAGNLSDVLRALVQNRDAFVRNTTGDRDPQETLRVLLGALDSFITIKINEDLAAAVNASVSDGNARLYFNEVILGTLLFTKNLTFRTVLDWEKRPIDRSAFTEALAGIMTMLLGRSLVLVGEGFMASLQADMRSACRHAAGQLGSRNDPFRAIGIQPGPEITALFADTLRIAGEVFGPLPEDARRRLRAVLYDVFETLPPDEAGQRELVDNLGDQFFIPNQDAVDEVKEELLSISRDRFQLFVERVLQAGGDLMLRGIEDAIQDAIRLAQEWERRIETAIAGLLASIAALERAIQEQLVQAQRAFQDAAAQFQRLLERLSQQSLRNRLRADLADRFYRDARSVLNDNPLYRPLPGDAKRFVKRVLKDVITDLIEGPVVDPIFDALGSVAGELDHLLDDMRELDPAEPLAPQLLDLLLDGLEDRIADQFGGTRPRIDVGFTVSLFGLSQHFSLGRIELPLSRVFSILRTAVAELDFYEDQLEATAIALADAFRKFIDVETAQRTHDDKARERDRLNKLLAEHTTTPKTVTIVSPAQSSVYRGDVDASIHLGGVPPSYLGCGVDEQQRALVFLNGELLDPLSFTVDHQPIAGGEGATQVPGVLKSVAAVRTGATGMLAGRPMTKTRRARLEQGLPAGLTIRFRIAARRLQAGTNSMIVVVIDPNGRRYQQAVSFAVTAGAKGPGNRVRLPPMAGLAPGGTPVTPKAGIGLHFDAAAIASRVAQGRREMQARSKKHLVAFRTALGPKR